MPRVRCANGAACGPAERGSGAYSCTGAPPGGSLEPHYPFVAVEVPPGDADEVSAMLFELGADGVEERNDETLTRGPVKGLVTVIASFASRDAAEAAVLAIKDSSPDLAPRVEEIVGDAWRDAWKEFFSPFPLTPRITVVPPWVTPRPETPTGGFLLELEPGRAFGTGLHATTALVSEILDARAPRLAGAEVLDVGTGSGILSLVALLYGAARALAIDIDPDSVEVVEENAARNGLAGRVEARAGTIDSVPGTFPWVLANIESRVLGPIAEDLARAVAKGGTLVLSGILESEHEALIRTYTSLSRPLSLVETRSSLAPGRAPPPKGAFQHAGGEAWIALVFEAP